MRCTEAEGVDKVVDLYSPVYLLEEEGGKKMRKIYNNLNFQLSWVTNLFTYC